MVFRGLQLLFPKNGGSCFLTGLGFPLLGNFLVKVGRTEGLSVGIGSGTGMTSDDLKMTAGMTGISRSSTLQPI